MHNRINYNRPCVLVQFHTRRRFRASLSIRASDSSHLVTYARQFCTNNPGHKIYPWVSVRSTLHHTILHNPTILHTRKFLHQPSTCVIYTDVWHHAPQDIIRLCIILQFYIRRHIFRRPVTCTRKYCPLQNTIQTHIRVVTFPFLIFTVRVMVMVTVESATRLKLVNIPPHDYTSCFLFYFWILCK